MRKLLTCAVAATCVSCVVAVSPRSSQAHGDCARSAGPRTAFYSLYSETLATTLNRFSPHDGCGHDGGNDHDHHDDGEKICSAGRYSPDPKAHVIKGTVGADVLVGTIGPDLIYGLGGADRIYGGGGDDHVIGGPGDDTIEGGGGDDNLWGGPGNDSIRGGTGNDHVVGENGQDRLEGEDGCDNVLGGSANDRLYGGAGADKLDGDNGAPTYGYGTADFCDGGPDQDTFVDCELP